MNRSAKTHLLKISPNFFCDVESGVKRFEIRKNDRDFREGDSFVLQECSCSGLTGRESGPFVIDYLLTGKDVFRYGLSSGYCIFTWR